MKYTNAEIAKEIITSYFENMATKNKLKPAGYIEYMEICHDDKILLEHLKAIKNIMEKAIEEIENK